MKALIRKAILLGDLCAIHVAVVGDVAGLAVKLTNLVAVFDAGIPVDTTRSDVHELTLDKAKR